MSKTKIWLTAAVLLILIGCLILCCVSVEAEGDFMKKKYETNRYEIYENDWDISVLAGTADVKFVLSEDGTTSVTCFEESKMKHTVAVKDGALVISLVDTRQWYDHINFGDFKTPKITVSLPAGEYGALLVESSTGKVYTSDKLLFDSMDIRLTTGNIQCLSSCHGRMSLKTSTGGITVNGVSADSLALSVTTGEVSVSGAELTGDLTLKASTGKAELSDVTCTGLVSSGSTGSLVMKNVIASESFSIKRSTGDVRFERCDAAEINVEVSTGDVTGTLLSDKTYLASSGTGKVCVPKDTVGGMCRVTASTGDIDLKTEN